MNQPEMQPKTHHEREAMTSTYEHLKVPSDGQSIIIRDGKLVVPDRPILPFIEGDGTGPDIWRASQPVFDAAVAKAYKGRRHIAWMEVYAGQKAFDKFNTWLPDDTIKDRKSVV